MATTDETQSKADSAGGDGDEVKEAPAKRKFSLKMIIMAVGGLVVLGGIGGGGYYFLFAGHGKEAAAAPAAPPTKPVVFLDMPAMPQPEAYIGNAGALFDEEGGIKVEGTRGFLAKFMESFAAWIEANAKA